MSKKLLESMTGINKDPFLQIINQKCLVTLFLCNKKEHVFTLFELIKLSSSILIFLLWTQLIFLKSVQ